MSNRRAALRLFIAYAMLGATGCATYEMWSPEVHNDTTTVTVSRAYQHAGYELTVTPPAADDAGVSSTH